jgi:L-lactate dehydrogenase complex protein LldE
MQNASDKLSDRPHVGLFVTCLVDIFRPQVGFAAVKLLEQSGCRVSVPTQQTCCGQPAYNSGDQAGTRKLARAVIELFEPFDFVVAPSGSCAAMIKLHFVGAFSEDAIMKVRAEALAARTHELVAFLVDQRGMTATDAAFSQSVTYHDSCSGLRELGIREQPRRLLGAVTGLRMTELADSDVCCGFGGTFCVKYPDISNRMVEDKTAAIASSGAETVLGGDMGCLLNMAGKLKREGSPVETRHVAEVLAGMTDNPAIGEAE